MNPIGMMFALIAGVILLPTLYMGVSTYADQVRATATALQMAHIQKAAEAYITTNAAVVEANSTASSPAIITVPMLVNTGFLPNGFNSMNPYGQTWQVQVLQPAANQLQALVLGVGGNAIPAKQSGMIATTAGDSGGVIGGGSGDYAVPGCSGGEACGAYAGWSVSTAGYQNVAAAHPAALIEYANNQLQSDYLYRVAVPGQPQLNTMQTNLNMGANSVTNANNVNAQSETLAAGNPNGQYGALQIGSNYYYGDGSNAAVRTPGGFYVQNQNGSGPASIDEVNNVQASGNITTPNTVQGGYVNSTGDVNAQYNSTANNAFAMNNYSWWANNAGNSWQSGTAIANASLGSNYIWSNGNIYAGGQVQANYDATLGTAGGSANIGWGCGPNGAIAANANGSGQVLACQGGSWQAMGGQMYFDVGSTGHGNTNFVAWNLGNWDYCGLIGAGNASNGEDTVYPSGGPYSNGQYTWYYESDGNVNGDDGWICGNYMPG